MYRVIIEKENVTILLELYKLTFLIATYFYKKNYITV